MANRPWSVSMPASVLGVWFSVVFAASCGGRTSPGDADLFGDRDGGRAGLAPLGSTALGGASSPGTATSRPGTPGTPSTGSTSNPRRPVPTPTTTGSSGGGIGVPAATGGPMLPEGCETPFGFIFVGEEFQPAPCTWCYCEPGGTQCKQDPNCDEPAPDPNGCAPEFCPTPNFGSSCCTSEGQCGLSDSLLTGGVCALNDPEGWPEPSCPEVVVGGSLSAPGCCMATGECGVWAEPIGLDCVQLNDQAPPNLGCLILK